MIGVKILEEANSPINGKITVVKSLGFGTYIQADGLTQSGGVVHDVWKTTLRSVRRSGFIVHSSLILGLGGGSAATLVKKFWPEARITGVDIDPIMVEMGEKYLGLDKVQVQVQVQDAYDFIIQKSKFKNQNYSLILVDLYRGYEYPKKFEDEKFLKLVLRLLTEDGVAVFNRIYFDDKRPLAVKFGKKLEKVFDKVDVFYPEANVMFVCSNT